MFVGFRIGSRSGGTVTRETKEFGLAFCKFKRKPTGARDRKERLWAKAQEETCAKRIGKGFVTS